MSIRAIIADDEPLARAAVRTLLESERDVEVVGEAGDGRTALERIRTLAPDLLFLDIKMPVMDGFAVLEQLSGYHIPVVVFVTAHNDYAVKAFEVQALDYLLKPFTRARFQQVLNYARRQIKMTREFDARPEAVGAFDEGDTGDDRRVHVGHGEGSQPRKVVVRHQGRIRLIELGSVDWIEASQNYAVVHVGSQEYILRTTLADFEARVPSRQFVRVHRSTIVNVERIREVVSKGHGDYDVVLASGTILKMSRYFKSRLFAGAIAGWRKRR